MKNMRKEKVQGYPSVCSSELRLDLFSNDWVVIATERAKRPSLFGKKGPCPFCSIHTRESPLLAMKKGRKIVSEKELSQWTSLVFPNHFPAFIPHCPLQSRTEGPLYRLMNATGFHEVMITRPHRRSFADLPLQSIREVMEVYHMRFRSLMKERIVSQIFIFHNHGKEAGASVPHPHSQIVTLPFVNADLKNELENARKLFNKRKKCMYCALADWERRAQTRIVFENKEFLVFCPFASKQSFEMSVLPKKHRVHFDKITDSQKDLLAEAFSVALRKLKKGLKDPSYNFYLHALPVSEKESKCYHWHWTILPRTELSAGFEVGAGMQISTVPPEIAADHLRKQKVSV